jgi:hypothetical protein
LVRKCKEAKGSERRIDEQGSSCAQSDMNTFANITASSSATTGSKRSNESTEFDMRKRQKITQMNVEKDCSSCLEDIISSVVAAPEIIPPINDVVMHDAASATAQPWNIQQINAAVRHHEAIPTTDNILVECSKCIEDIICDILTKQIQTAADAEATGHVQKHEAESTPFLWPVTEGLRYTSIVTKPGSLGFVLNDSYPHEFNKLWVPKIQSIDPEGGAFGCGKGIVPNGIRVGDMITHVGNVPLIGTSMNRVVELVVNSKRPLSLTLCRSLSSTRKTLEDHVQKFKDDATWRGRERANAKNNLQELQATIINLEEKNSKLRKHAQLGMLEKAKLQRQVKLLNDQLRKETFGVLKNISDDAAAAVARPQQNASLKDQLESTKGQLEVIQNQWDRKIAQEDYLREKLPKRFKKMLAKTIKGRMVINVAAVVSAAPINALEDVKFHIENIDDRVYQALFGKCGINVEKKEGSSGSFKILSVRAMENILGVTLSKNLTVQISDIDVQYRVEILEKPEANDIVLNYNSDARSLKISCKLQTKEVETGIASLGKQARFA